MKPVIADLVERYDRGRLSRRELVQGLALLVAAAQSAGAAEPGSFTASGIDHVSIRVSDMERSVQFYQSLFGLSVLSEDHEHRIRRLGGKRVIISLRQDTPHAMIDHFGVAVEGFKRDEATRVLKARGLTPEENWEYGFHVRDPDGAVVQFIPV